ncbi:MAG TPA: protein kinase [Blastocatellia bacterium]|nr:protein kinase [Blastocatellia bacterium]
MGSLKSGDVLKHYRVAGKLGQGGMGEVYLAEDTRLNRYVAIKLLTASTVEDDSARRRLLQEARSAAALNHPSIVTVHAIDDHEGLDFIVMEYVEGETLKSVVERGSLPLAQLLDIGAQVAGALASAHALNIIHRDIKSANILLTSAGRAKVLDFGLAKSTPTLVEELDREAPTRLALTGAGIVLGTVPYMSPEQTRGESLDGRTDIFSLGCVLYEAATGGLPFGGASTLSIIHDIATVNPPPPSRFRPDLPAEFDLIVSRALAKDRDGRYKSASEMADALRSLEGSSASFAPITAITGPLAGDAETDSFVGREPEMKELDRLLRRAADGAGRVAFVTGEPGIGKTAVVEEFLRRSRKKYSNVIITRGRCVEQYGTGEAYLPFLDAVGAMLAGPGRERIAALLRTYAPNWCLQFPAIFVSSGIWENLQQETMGVTKERMLREMGDALAALASGAAVVLVLEDLHWADPSSIDLLRHLAQRIASKRLLIVGTFRPAEVELNDHPLKMCKLELQAHNLSDEISLGSLGREHIAAFLDLRFSPNDLPAELAAVIERKTEGHPLFAISLAEFMAESRDIAKKDGRWSISRELSEMNLEAPENVRSMIRKKIEGLDEIDRRALQYASVEGNEFLSTVVANLLVADDLELEERLAKLDRVHRLVVTVGEEELPDGALATRYRFAHALYQNVLYADLVSKRRILLHRQAGEQLAAHYGKQSPRIAAQLAMHFERGRDFKRAADYFVYAGDNAIRLYAGAEALEHYERSLALAEKLPEDEKAELLLTIYQKRGAVNLALGRFQLAVDDYTEMLERARSLGSVTKESAALNALTMTLFYSHRLDEITARADEILRTAERAGSDALRIEAMQVIALNHLGRGELDRARPMLDDIIQSARRLNHRPVLLTGLAWRAILHFFQTEYDAAEPMLMEARALASDLSDGFLLLESYFVLGMVQGNQGRMSEALATFERGLEIAARNGDGFWSPRIPNCIGWVYREIQDFQNAIKYDRQGAEIGERMKVLEAQANSLINLGIDYGRAGQGEHTLISFSEVERIFQKDTWFKWRYNIRLQAGKAEHWLRQGDDERAEKYARRLLETAQAHEARKYVAVAHRLLAEVAINRGDLDLARVEIGAALDQLDTHPVPIVAWKTFGLLGRLREKLEDPSGAREAFDEAASIVDRIAASLADETSRQIFINSPAVVSVFEGAGRVIQTAKND